MKNCSNTCKIWSRFKTIFTKNIIDLTFHISFCYFIKYLFTLFLYFQDTFTLCIIQKNTEEKKIKLKKRRIE